MSGAVKPAGGAVVAPPTEPTPIQVLAGFIAGVVTDEFGRDQETSRAILEGAGLQGALDDSGDPRSLLVLVHELKARGLLSVATVLPPLGVDVSKYESDPDE